VTDQKVPLSERPTGSDHLGVPRVRAGLRRSVISSGSLEISCVGGARAASSRHHRHPRHDPPMASVPHRAQVDVLERSVQLSRRARRDPATGLRMAEENPTWATAQARHTARDYGWSVMIKEELEKRERTSGRPVWLSRIAQVVVGLLDIVAAEVFFCTHSTRRLSRRSSNYWRGQIQRICRDAGTSCDGKASPTADARAYCRS
jgi:hypothetical protein